MPDADHAERVVIGCAIATPEGWTLASQRLTADDFHDARYRRLFEACTHLDGVTNEDDRVGVVCAVSGVSLGCVTDLLRWRNCMFDQSGWFARRVRDAAIRRRLMAECAEVYTELGRGARLYDVTGRVNALVAIANGERVGVLVAHGRSALTAMAWEEVAA